MTQATPKMVAKEFMSFLETTNDMGDWFKFEPDPEDTTRGTVYQYMDDGFEVEIGKFSVNMTLDDDRPEISEDAVNELDN